MHRHTHYFYFFRNRELNELYASVAIRSFALSLISVFVPIYLLQLGYSLPTVLFFFAVLLGTHALFVIPATALAAKYGFKHAILFSVPLLIIFYLLLYTLDSYNWPLYLLAIIYGINNSLFWMGYHTHFCKFSDGKRRGKQISVTMIVSSLFGVAGPLTGGTILAFIGFKFLFSLVSILLLASAIPLFFSKDSHNPINFPLKKIFTDQKINNYLGYIGYGIENGVAGVIWPIFIFFSILNNFTYLGFVASIFLFFSLIFTFIIGKFSDIKRKLVLKIGAVLNAIIWIVKSLVTTIFQVFIIDSLYGITRTMRDIPFDAVSYDKASATNIVRTIMFREIAIQVGGVILLIAMIFITDLTISFYFAGGASLLYFFF